MRIYDLMNMDDLNQELLNGYVRVQKHPLWSEYKIYNYTEKAQFDNHWNHITMACRGLIVRGEEVVARPFPKFFNYEQRKQHFDGRIIDPVEVTDKMDGSLGIHYWTPNGPAIATRGSFQSEQAIKGTELLKRYGYVVPLTWTPLFEIVYPANRIVCDYGPIEGLFLLGAVKANGEVVGPKKAAERMEWNGPVTETISARTFADALAMTPREGKEGIVVRFLSNNEMCKIKQEDYVTLHKLVTGLSERAVWEGLGQGKTVAQICEPLPDEFHAWVADVADKLNMAYEKKIFELDNEFLDLLTWRMKEEFTRKEFALVAKDSPNRGFLFTMLDEVDIGPKVWQTLRPVGDTRKFNAQTEDTA